MMINRALVHADVQRAIRHWGSSGVHHLNPDTSLDAAVDTAIAVVVEPTAIVTPGSRFCVVTKGPHLRDRLSLACVAARLTAFGVAVRAVRRIDDAAPHVVRSLYPKASRYFAHGPTAPALWDRLALRFGTDDFAMIFGCRYDRSMVAAGADVIRENGLSEAEFTEIWETGRNVVTRESLVRDYGARAADFILKGARSHDWFRGELPVGISRIASAITAFAMRHERINGGAPVIVINGHVPGLAGLFAPAVWVFDLALGAEGVQIGDVRRVLVGDDGRPERCRRGSLRRDAVDGLLPLGSTAALDSRRNLLHCSDGLVAGLMEVRRLLPDRAVAPDLLTGGLIRAGLTEPEISRVVLADPRILSGTPEGYLSDLTRGLDLTACMTEILRVVPPVFGGGNGWADGLGFEMFARELQRAATASPCVSRDTGARPLAEAVVPGVHEEDAGRRAIESGKVGMLVPAGGTGGRFGGYDVPEADPSRQKALAPVFVLGDRRMCSLDIRMANVRYWDEGVGDRLPVAVMGSPTGEAALRRWRDNLDDPYRKSLRIFVQHGVYRLDRSLPGADPGGAWVDAILRDAAGRPSLKPPGNLGLLSGFILSGLFDVWERRRIEYIVSANGDDVGFRLDPHVIGHLARNPAVDGVIVGVPWGYTTTVRRGGAVLSARGDESGWFVDSTGAPLAGRVPLSDRTYDQGGALCGAPGDSGPRLSVVEGGPYAGALFNTNQIYLRLSAIRRLVDRIGVGDLVGAVQQFIAGQPVVVEDKSVIVDGVKRDARQIVQPFHGVLSRLSRCDVTTTTRRVGPGVQGSYAPLKDRSDVPFAQLILDGLRGGPDDLVLPPP